MFKRLTAIAALAILLSGCVAPELEQDGGIGGTGSAVHAEPAN